MATPIQNLQYMSPSKMHWQGWCSICVQIFKLETFASYNLSHKKLESLHETHYIYNYVFTTMQCKHLWFQRQTGRLQSTVASHPNTSISMPHWRASIRAIQLFVALLSIVWDGWGDDHWFAVNKKKWPPPPQDAQHCCSAAVWFGVRLPVIRLKSITSPFYMVCTSTH